MQKRQAGFSRRDLLRGAALLVPAWSLQLSGNDDRPEVTHPRAISGDDRFEPKWDERLTVTIGPDKADMTGTTDKVIQAAVD